MPGGSGCHQHLGFPHLPGHHRLCLSPPPVEGGAHQPSPGGRLCHPGRWPEPGPLLAVFQTLQSPARWGRAGQGTDRLRGFHDHLGLFPLRAHHFPTDRVAAAAVQVGHPAVPAVDSKALGDPAPFERALRSAGARTNQGLSPRRVCPGRCADRSGRASLASLLGIGFAGSSPRPGCAVAFVPRSFHRRVVHLFSDLHRFPRPGGL